MKICVISTTIMPVPPKGYSGLEFLAYQHAEGLAKKGHQVLLIAPGTQFGTVVPPGVELHGTTLGESEKQAYSGYWERLLSVDAIIDSSWSKWSYILKKEGKLKAPILGVLHAPAETMYHSPPPVDKPCLVAISNDQSGAVMGHLGLQSRVAYNGVDMNFYKANSKQRTDRYLFLARMSKLKGPHIAALAAQTLGCNLDLVGDDKLVESPDYVQHVKSMCHGTRIVYHGEKSREECVTFFSEAKALLHCNAVFREPFGLAPVEAQACGCPVIAWDHGAMRETINHGKTGFLVRTFKELCDYIMTDAIRDIEPAVCRKWASQFSVENMVDRYEALVKEALETGGW
jgi:glycosyltransferase involved in cell wall biosynthesis